MWHSHYCYRDRRLLSMVVIIVKVWWHRIIAIVVWWRSIVVVVVAIFLFGQSESTTEFRRIQAVLAYAQERIGGRRGNY